jgi:hypothetical protein
VESKIVYLLAFKNSNAKAVFLRLSDIFLFFQNLNYLMIDLYITSPSPGNLCLNIKDEQVATITQTIMYAKD